jgi:hypothetical protein
MKYSVHFNPCDPVGDRKVPYSSVDKTLQTGTELESS